MADPICPHCQHPGFVRSETVVKAAVTYQLFYCGRCDVSWRSLANQTITQDGAAADEKPEPSRPKPSRSN
jgi:transcription elongation factor Elf1